jgi:similar to stage IV sporulation protein
MAIFVFSLLLSVLLVWSVEVDGNVAISEAEICEKMEEIGLKPGVWIRSVNTGDFSLLFQVKNPEFSFASLNVIGTRAVLSVRERTEWNEIEESAPDSEGKANLVSSVSGTVLRYEVLAGQVMVKRGEVVPKGALLVSGVVERPNGAYRVVEAKGKVFAQTQRYFQVTVPFSRVKSAYTGNEETKKRYRILDFVFSPLDYEDSPYDRFNVTKSREQVEILGKKLPIVCEIKTYHETEEKNKALTVDSAKNLAYDKYEEYKGENLLPGYKILEESVSLTQNEEGLTLSVELTLEEDIATPLPFSYVESSEMERITNVRENH